MSLCNLYNICEHSGRAHGDSGSTIMTALCRPRTHLVGTHLGGSLRVFVFPVPTTAHFDPHEFA